jgi:Cu/Ag efflux protein CusF
MKRILSLLTAAAVLACGNAFAASKAAASTGTLAKSEIKSIDKEAMTITVVSAKDQKEKTLQITSKTRLFRGKKNATTEDLKVGDKISGAVRTSGSTVEAERLVIDAAGDTAAPAPKKSSKPARKP